MFTKEDISSLRVADAKFQEAKSDYLGPLVVTPELVAKKIKAIKDNKSPETVEQINIPLARVFNLSLKRELFRLNGKKQTSYHYLKRVREISKRITDQ